MKQFGVNILEVIRGSTSVGDSWALQCSCHKAKTIHLANRFSFKLQLLLLDLEACDSYSDIATTIVVLKHDKEMNPY